MTVEPPRPGRGDWPPGTILDLAVVVGGRWLPRRLNWSGLGLGLATSATMVGIYEWWEILTDEGYEIEVMYEG